MTNKFIKGYRSLHEKLLFSGRCCALTNYLCDFFPDDANQSIIDVGCGDGRISCGISKIKTNLNFLGIDVFSRDSCAINFQVYDGKKIPFDDKSHDYVMFVDVLHHTNNIEDLLLEAKRVARKRIIIKDHYSNNIIDDFLLRVADIVGNFSYGVNLPFNFLSKKEWEDMFIKNSFTQTKIQTEFKLYPSILNKIFGERIQFITSLEW